MVKVNCKTILSILLLIAALLLSSNAIRFQQNTGSSHLGAHSTGYIHSDGPRESFADLFDQDIWDNSTIYAAPEPDFSHLTRLFFGELLQKCYDSSWAVLLVFVILFPLAVDHAMNFHRKREQLYLMFIMCSSFAYAMVAFWGVYNRMFVKGSTVSKNLDIILSAIIQVYTGLVVIFYWWFLFACLDFAHPNVALSLESRSTHHQFHSYDLRFLLPKPVLFTPMIVKRVSQMLYLYILVRIIGMALCLLVVGYFRHEYHFWIEIGIDVVMFGYELVAHYWLDLFYKAVHHDLTSPIHHKMFFYVQVLAFVSSLQEWLLKFLCVFFYLIGIGRLFMISDVLLVQNALLMLEVVPLAIAVYGRFTVGTYLSFVLAMSCPDSHVSRKGD